MKDIGNLNLFIWLIILSNMNTLFPNTYQCNGYLRDYNKYLKLLLKKLNIWHIIKLSHTHKYLTDFNSVFSKRYWGLRGRFICVIRAYYNRGNPRISKTYVRSQDGSLICHKSVRYPRMKFWSQCLTKLRVKLEPYMYTWVYLDPYI